MALRVLLADESISIKKVMQLSLQDYGVEVKAVPVGIDVLDAAQSFNPDIVFADILLTKKSGYEVAKELKDNPSTAKIPVVLMWSGFMELDAQKSKEAQIAGQLEKPFDADQLRTLVKKLVPRLNTNVIANFLEFPERPEFEESAEEQSTPMSAADEGPVGLDLSPPPVTLQKSFGSAPKPTPQPSMTSAPAPMPAPEEDSLPFLAEMDEPEDFQQVPLPRARTSPTSLEAAEEPWTQTNLSDFLVEMPEDSQAFETPEQDLASTSIALAGEEGELSLDDLDQPNVFHKTAQPKPPNTPPAQNDSLLRDTPALSRLSAQQIEAIAREEIRAQTQQVLEDIAWKIIPEMAERIIREELEKLIKESQNLGQ